MFPQIWEKVFQNQQRHMEKQGQCCALSSFSHSLVSLFFPSPLLTLWNWPGAPTECSPELRHLIGYRQQPCWIHCLTFSYFPVLSDPSGDCPHSNPSTSVIPSRSAFGIYMLPTCFPFCCSARRGILFVESLIFTLLQGVVKDKASVFPAVLQTVLNYFWDAALIDWAFIALSLKSYGGNFYH